MACLATTFGHLLPSSLTLRRGEAPSRRAAEQGVSRRTGLAKRPPQRPLLNPHPCEDLEGVEALVEAEGALLAAVGALHEVLASDQIAARHAALQPVYLQPMRCKPLPFTLWAMRARAMRARDASTRDASTRAVSSRVRA